MPGPAKTTSANKSVRVTEGSALERLTQGKPFTETVHKMAELFEKALAENWGPQPVHVGIDWGGDPDRTVEVFVDDEGEVLQAQELGGRRFVIGHNERDQQVVDEAQVLELARDQYPVGLVPIGIDDEAEELPREMTEQEARDNQDVEEMFDPTGAEREAHDLGVVKERAMELVDDEDLSYLI
jgi:hypothetical protein